MKKTGRMIRNARNLQGMKQEELADALKTSRQRIGRLENGVNSHGEEAQIDELTLVKIADILSLDAEELLESEGYGTDFPISNVRSTNGILQSIDLVGLTHHQRKLVESLVQELKKDN